MSTPSRHLSDSAAIAVVSLIFFTWGGLTSLDAVPLLQGALADRIGIQLAFVIPLVCYAYIVWYGLRGSRLKGDELAVATSAGRAAGPMH